MQFKSIPVHLRVGDTVTCLYHSPLDLNLFYILSLAKTGLNLRVIIDDIDNLGVLHRCENCEYNYINKYFLSKTERANIRSLSFVLPKHLFANVSIPGLKELDAKIKIRNIKDCLLYNDKVEHWIRDVTTEFGSYAIVGPDRAFGFTNIDPDFISSIDNAILHLKSIICTNFPHYSSTAFDFIGWLFEDKNSHDSISAYFVALLQKIIRRFGLENTVTIERMSDHIHNQYNLQTYKDFLSIVEFQKAYNEAINIDGRKTEESVPFYSIARKDGMRMLNPKLAIENHRNYFLAPKVLMLNNLHNLVLPIEAMQRPNVLAREIVYGSGFVNSNQIFSTNEWLFEISSAIKNVTLSPIEQSITDIENASLTDVLNWFLRIRYDYEHGEKKKALQLYKEWILASTLKSLIQYCYPLIFLCLLQEKAFATKIPKFYALYQTK